MSKLRGMAYSEWRGSGQLKEYVSSTLTHGSVLRDNAVALTEKAWHEAGVSDEQVLDILRRKEEHTTNKQDYEKKVDDALNEWTELQKTPNWQKDPEISARVKELGDTWATLMDDWTAKATAFNKELLTVNTRRRDLFVKSVQETLAAERDLGGDPLLADDPSVSRADSVMVDGIIQMFPADMIKFANSRMIPMHVRRSKVRAHYIGRTRRKRKSSRAGVLNAVEALNGDRYWHASMNYLTLDQDGLKDSHVPRRDTVESTPENRAALEDRIRQWREENPRAPKARHPVITEVDFEMESGPEKRLALHIPEAYSSFTRENAVTSELTFSDPTSVAHEFGHHLEFDNPEIGLACKEFLARRTEGWEKVTYKKGRTRAKDEIVTPDSFVDSYIGKHYDDAAYHTEVFSMGVEALMTGSHGGLLGIEIETRTLSEGLQKRYKSDPEHFALVMGLLSAANKKFD